jgi:hypothetical protein
MKKAFVKIRVIIGKTISLVHRIKTFVNFYEIFKNFLLYLS